MTRNAHGIAGVLTEAPPPRRRRRLMPWLLVLAVVLFSATTTLSYYVDALWFESLGYASVFWTRLNLQATIFTAFALSSFLALYGVFWALKPARFGELIGDTVYINQQPLKLPIDPVLNLTALALPLLVGVVTGTSMMDRWTTLALYWHAPPGMTGLDPIFGRPL